MASVLKKLQKLRQKEGKPTRDEIQELGSSDSEEKDDNEARVEAQGDDAESAEQESAEGEIAAAVDSEDDLSLR